MTSANVQPLTLKVVVRPIHGHVWHSLVKNGYKLPMTTIPPSCFSNNNKSALKHPEFVANAIGKLLDDGRITEVFSPPRCINPLTVVESKELRLVSDLRHVNKYLVAPKLKYDNLKSLSEIFEENYWFFTWDL